MDIVEEREIRKEAQKALNNFFKKYLELCESPQDYVAPEFMRWYDTEKTVWLRVTRPIRFASSDGSDYSLKKGFTFGILLDEKPTKVGFDWSSYEAIVAVFQRKGGLYQTICLDTGYGYAYGTIAECATTALSSFIDVIGYEAKQKNLDENGYLVFRPEIFTNITKHKNQRER